MSLLSYEVTSHCQYNVAFSVLGRLFIITPSPTVTNPPRYFFPIFNPKLLHNVGSEFDESNYTDFKQRNLRRLACRNTSLPIVKAIIFDGLWNQPDEFFEELLLHDIKGMIPMEFVARYENEPNSPFHTAFSNFCRAALHKKGGYLDYLRAVSSNPSRMRRVLCHVINGFDELEHNEVGPFRNQNFSPLVRSNDTNAECLGERSRRNSQCLDSICHQESNHIMGSLDKIGGHATCYRAWH
jgi:hypothetical protein